MISVIIPHLGQPDHLRRCLKSLRRQQGASAAEIIVVDNGSPILPAALCAEFGARLFSEPVPGPGPARNLGASEAQGEFLAFIDADCIATPGWLAGIERAFRDDPEAGPEVGPEIGPEIGIVGGDVRIACRDPSRPTWLEAYESVFAFRMKEYIRRQGFTGTGNLAVRRSVFRAVGPFGGIDIAEDREWGQRALGLGYRTHYRADVIVYHPARDSFAEIARKWERHIAHDLEAARQKPGWRSRWVLRAIAVAGSPAFELVRIGFSDRIGGTRARLLAFGGAVLVRAFRAWTMLALAFGRSSPDVARRWNRA